MKPIALASAALLSACSTLAAQGSAARDSAQCRALVEVPPRDSLTDTIGVAIVAFDSAQVLSAEYRGMFAQVIRAALRVPPLSLRVYMLAAPDGHPSSSSEPVIVVPTVWGVYRLTAWRDGHATRTRVVGGARNSRFDDAFLAALRVLSDSSALPPFPASLGSKSLELRLEVESMPRTAEERLVAKSLSRVAPTEPLFLTRVPVIGRGTPPAPLPGNRAPRYPEAGRRLSVDGKTTLKFIVDASGRADLSSIQVLEATAADFARAALEVMPSYRFTPLQVGQCGVASIVQLPFEFNIRYD